MRVLVVEDEVLISENLKAGLEKAGFLADCVFDGIVAEGQGMSNVYDCVILDLGLPLLDGISLLKRWRDAGNTVPVLVLTARNRWSDKLAGFSTGADDYVVKPFSLHEVLLRVRALIRRAAGQASSVLRCGPLSLDTHTSQLLVNDCPLQVTPHEYRLLEYLMHHQGRLVTRTTLIEHIHEDGGALNANAVDVIVSRIRRKLSINIIQTVRGQGYRLALEKI